MKDYLDIYAQIDHIYNPTKTEFNEKYGFKFKPVLIEGLMDNWKAKTKWTPDFFKEKFGQRDEPAVRNFDRNDKKTFKVGDYFNYMENTTDKDPYYLKNSKFHLKTEMENDYEVPSYFKNCLQIMADKLPLEFQLSWMYIGATNTFSGLHLDIFNTSAWNAVISGKKVWLFYPPHQAQYLYNGQVNPFEPDLVKYPLFEKAKPLVCVQNPGEVVFTPSGWWHAVYNEAGGVSITENFINEVNYDIVKMTLLHYKKTDEARIVDTCMSLFKN